MATLYITSADASGEGTLAALIAAAVDGDVITPDPSLGSLEIILTGAEYLWDIAAEITIDGGDAGLTLVRTTTAYPRVKLATAGTVRFKNVTFEMLDGLTVSAPLIRLQDEGNLTFECCGFYGNRTTSTNAGAVCTFLGNGALTFSNCVIAGNVNIGGAGSFAYSALVYCGSASRAKRVRFVNCTVVGNWLARAVSFQETIPSPFTDCKLDVEGMVAPPDITMSWESGLWRAWNLHIVNDAVDARGYNSVGERYDLEGVPRVNGTLGALETIDADLYWVGVDANGDAVETPSLESADGWASDRWATTGGGVAPAEVETLFVGGAVEFAGTWAPPAGGVLITGGGAVKVSTQAPATGRVIARVGAGGLSVTGAVALTNGDDLGSLTPVSPVVVDVLAPATVSGETRIDAGVRFRVVAATFQRLLIEGGALEISEKAEVTGEFVMGTTAPGEVILTSEGALLSTTGAQLQNGTITSTARAYLNVMAAANLSGITLGEQVIRLNMDAGASNFLAETTIEVVNFTWSAASGQTSTLEKVSPYQMIDAAADASNPPTTTVYAPTTFRLWSGSDWLTAVASPRHPSYLWTVEPWALTLADVEDVAYNVAVWGLNPNITYVETGGAETTVED